MNASSSFDNKDQVHPPPARGVRLAWEAMPQRIRSMVEEQLGSLVVSAVSQQGGFSPGAAVRLRCADGRRVFVKAISPEQNPDTPNIYRREAQIAALIPITAPVPRLLWSVDEGAAGWVVLAFEDVEGRQPAQPWRTDELERVLEALKALSDALTPSPLSIEVVGSASDEIDRRVSGWRWLREAQPSHLDRLDDWSARHLPELAKLEAQAAEAAAGNTLLHLDLRADNMLLTPERVWIVDWPEARVGAAWVDMVFFVPSVAMQGGLPPEALLARHPACRAADPNAITTVVAAITGYFIERSLRPPPPGLPTVRAFQAAQGVVAREWLAQRTGWK